ncbi:signal recognition particle-docking protein FtsY [Defluviitalea phaphyphila]|uniref:signal recognition particle-docking protein FtsY n=1 Tax=Defluviitalea phaphyphila TaxID=1473580 RepID=UPI000730FEC0
MVEEKVSQPKKSFFSKLVKGLTKTRSNIMDGIDQVLKSFKKIDEELYEELEEALIMADIGVSTTMNIMENLRKRVKEEKITEAIELRQLLIEEISKLLEKGNHEVNIEEGPVVILVIGVNGVGKTTTIGKLAHNFKKQKKKVLLAAADTFRAAAIEQLEVWGDRVGVDVIRHQENSDPAAVIFDAIQAAKSRKIDVLICDTAGRLHNKKNLMEELKKIFRIITREYPEAKKEVFLVLDATTGQNALQQVKLFKEVADISGIVLTKLDGTAKGGIIVGISSEMNIPVKYIGVGEGIDDLQPFNPKEFATALFANYDD